MKIAAFNGDPEHVSEEDFATMISAAQISLDDFCTAWDYAPCVISEVAAASDAEADEFVLTVVHSADVPGAGGFHDVDKRGRPFLRVFTKPYLDNGGVLIAERAEDFTSSVLGAFTHECLETVMDRDCRGYELVGQGKFLTAREPCDACEDIGYPVDADGREVWVTDFLLPGWFTGHGPLTKSDALDRPWPHMTPGGYRIDVAAKGSPRARQSRERKTSHGAARARPATFAETPDEEPSIGPVIHFGDEMPTWKRAQKLNHGRLGKRARGL